jgi:hypothetical protein
MPHDQEHPISGGSTDHTAGTNGTLVGTEAGAVVEKTFGTAATASTIVQRGGSGQITLPSADPASATDAASKGYVDGLVTGHRAPVSVLKIKSDVAQAGAPPVGEAIGNAWVVNTWGVGYNNGDLVELTSTGPDVWTVIVPNVAGVVPTGTRAVVIGDGSAAGSFAPGGPPVPQTNKIAQKTAGGWSFTDPSDGDQVAVIGEASVYENLMYIWDAAPGTWVAMGGTPAHNSLTGLDGGTPGQYYHMTSSEHTEALRYKADVTQGSATPTKPGTWNNGDRGVIITTSGTTKYWWCYVTSGGVLVAVRMT